MSRSATTLLKRWQPAIATAAFALALWLVYRALGDYSAEEIKASITAISLDRIALALLLTVGSFACLSGFDYLAVRYTGSDLPYRRIALASFTALSIGHVLGMAALSSGAIRYRYYSRWGLSAGDIGRIVIFCGVTVAVGIATAGALAALVRPGLLGELFGIGRGVILASGTALAAAVLGHIALSAFWRRPVRIRQFELPVPTPRLALGQVVVGGGDFLMVAGVLHQMVSASADVPYTAIAASYVTANTIGIATHVPGGVGVIEAVVLSLVPGAHVVGALIAFRALYYLLPFLLGCLILFATEVHHRRHAAAVHHRRRATVEPDNGRSGAGSRPPPSGSSVAPSRPVDSREADSTTRE